MSDFSNARLVRRTKTSLLLMLLAFPLAIWGTFRALHSLNDDVLSWTAGDVPARESFEWFSGIFDSPNAILVSWRGATLDDPRMVRFAEALSEPGETTRLIQAVITGRDVYDDLTASPPGFSHAQAIRRLQGIFVGPDRRTSCSVVLLEDGAARQARHLIDTIRATAGECGVPPDDLHMVGYVVETASLDNAALKTLYWLSIPSAVLVVGVAWPCLRSFSLAMVVWLAATFCQCVCLASIYVSSGRMNGMMTILPILIMVIFVSSAVHLVNYYHEAAKEGDPSGAPARALSTGWFPCSLAVVTTAIGIGSLSLSGTVPVRSFGMHAAVGTLFTLVVLFSVLPGAIHLTLGRTGEEDHWGDRSLHRILGRRWSWQPVAEVVQHRGTAIVSVFLIAMCVSGAGLVWLQGSMQTTDFLSETDRTTQDHRWFQEHVGPLLPLEIIVSFQRQGPPSTVERLKLVTDVEAAVASMSDPTASVSLAAFLPEPAMGAGSRATIRRSFMNAGIDARKAAIAASNPYFAVSGDRELWRINARIEGLNGRRYEHSLAEIRRLVEPVLENARRRYGDTVSMTYTGMLPLLAACHSTLIRDLAVSFSVSLLLIGMVLVFGLRSFRLGLLSILPNVFPIVLVFGILGWLGKTIDVGSMMTASVGLGIAVDGTVHYLNWFLRGRQAGLSHNESILKAYQHAARAMVRTTAICGAGLIVYATSSFLPAARFGWIVCMLLLAALAGDLLLLPALLAGRTGQVLFPDHEHDVPSTAGQEAAHEG